MTKLTWGIIGAGGIAKNFAKGVAHSKTGTLLAVASRDQTKADKFGEELSIPRRYGSYEALLADKDVQAVHIATPHPMHAQWAIAAAEAGKHILCEKPIGINYAEALAIIDAAQRNDVFLMEAFMYRCHPQTAKIIELVRERAIGDVRVIQATFSFHAGFNAEGRLFKNALAGGGILDVGGYCTSMSRLIAGAAVGKDFAEPIEVKGSGFLGTTGVDEWAVGTLKFASGIVASIAAGVSVNQDNTLRIFGSAGRIEVPSAWIPSREGGTTKIIVHRNGKPAEEIAIETGDYLYGLEADTVAANIERRQAVSPAMTWADTLGNMKALDSWRSAIGLVYEAEKPANVTYTHSRRPLVVKQPNSMKFGQVPGVAKPVSRLVMGSMAATNMPYTALMFDDYIERGGNAFDTAWIYGGGNCDRLLGQWVKNRGVREQVVIIGKGAHSPYCYPANLTHQLKESLQRLQMDYMDIYFMHRDNEDVPVGEFVDVLNEHHKAGRIRAFGGSNWTTARIDAANEYAKKKGLVGFTAISNNFSLANMVDAPWGGCLASSDPAGRAWLTRTQMTLMPWSSQAQGFFADRFTPEEKSNRDMVRCWYSDENFARKDRAAELARKKGVDTITIALAYVLHQPFPTFPLIGPATPAELRSSLRALEIELTPEEVKWLEDGE